jgi:signal transduction histidine kinase
MTELPLEMLRRWPGRFRFPELLVLLVGDEPTGPEALCAAVLASLETPRDERAAAVELISRGWFRAALHLLENCQELLESEADGLRRQLDQQRTKAQQNLAGRLDDMERRAEAADVLVPLELDGDAMARQADQDWPTVEKRLDKADDNLREAIRQRREQLDKYVTELDTEGSVATLRSLLAAGELRAAERLLAEGGLSSAPPEAVPWMPELPDEQPEDMLQWHLDPSVRAPLKFGDWQARHDGQDLLRAYDGLHRDGEDAATDLLLALARFLGVPAPTGPPRKVRDGYFAQLPEALADSRLRRLLPVPTLNLYICEPDVAGPPEDDSLSHYAVVGPSLSTANRADRSPGAILDLAGLLRLVTLRQDRMVGLLRLLAPQWPLAALGAGSPHQLDATLGGLATRWPALRWIADLAGLGGSAAAATLAFQSDFQPHVLHTLLKYLAEPGVGAVTAARLGTLRETRGDLPPMVGLETAVLRPARDHPAAMLAFWAALAAAPPGVTVSVDDMMLEVELSVHPEGKKGQAELKPRLQVGVAELGSLPGMLTRASIDAVQLPKSGALLRLREHADRRLRQLLIREAQGPTAVVGPGLGRWTIYQYALSPSWSAGNELLATGQEIPADLLAELRSGTENPVPTEQAEPYDVYPVLEEMRAAFESAHPDVHLHLEVGTSARTTVPAPALRAILFELLNNSTEAMHGAGDLSLTARPLDDEIVIRVSDSGSGIGEEIEESHQIFRRDVSTHGGDRGRGLYRARRLARQLGGDVELVERNRRHPVFHGAHFRVVLPALS